MTEEQEQVYGAGASQDHSAHSSPKVCGGENWAPEQSTSSLYYSAADGYDINHRPVSSSMYYSAADGFESQRGAQSSLYFSAVDGSHKTQSQSMSFNAHSSQVVGSPDGGFWAESSMNSAFGDDDHDHNEAESAAHFAVDDEAEEEFYEPSALERTVAEFDCTPLIDPESPSFTFEAGGTEATNLLLSPAAVDEASQPAQQSASTDASFPLLGGEIAESPQAGDSAQLQSFFAMEGLTLDIEAKDGVNAGEGVGQETQGVCRREDDFGTLGAESERLKAVEQDSNCGSQEDEPCAQSSEICGNIRLTSPEIGCAQSGEAAQPSTNQMVTTPDCKSVENCSHTAEGDIEDGAKCLSESPGESPSSKEAGRDEQNENEAGSDRNMGNESEHVKERLDRIGDTCCSPQVPVCAGTVDIAGTDEMSAQGNSEIDGRDASEDECDEELFAACGRDPAEHGAEKKVVSKRSIPVAESAATERLPQISEEMGEEELRASVASVDACRSEEEMFKGEVSADECRSQGEHCKREEEPLGAGDGTDKEIELCTGLPATDEPAADDALGALDACEAGHKSMPVEWVQPPVEILAAGQNFTGAGEPVESQESRTQVASVSEERACSAAAEQVTGAGDGADEEIERAPANVFSCKDAASDMENASAEGMLGGAPAQREEFAGQQAGTDFSSNESGVERLRETSHRSPPVHVDTGEKKVDKEYNVEQVEDHILDQGCGGLASTQSNDPGIVVEGSQAVCEVDAQSIPVFDIASCGAGDSTDCDALCTERFPIFDEAVVESGRSQFSEVSTCALHQEVGAQEVGLLPCLLAVDASSVEEGTGVAETKHQLPSANPECAEDGLDNDAGPCAEQDGRTEEAAASLAEAEVEAEVRRDCREDECECECECKCGEQVEVFATSGRVGAPTEEVDDSLASTTSILVADPAAAERLPQICEELSKDALRLSVDACRKEVCPASALAQSQDGEEDPDVVEESLIAAMMEDDGVDDLRGEKDGAQQGEQGEDEAQEDAAKEVATREEEEQGTLEAHEARSQAPSPGEIEAREDEEQDTVEAQSQAPPPGERDARGDEEQDTSQHPPPGEIEAREDEEQDALESHEARSQAPPLGEIEARGDEEQDALEAHEARSQAPPLGEIEAREDEEQDTVEAQSQAPPLTESETTAEELQDPPQSRPPGENEAREDELQDTVETDEPMSEAPPLAESEPMPTPTHLESEPAEGALELGKAVTDHAGAERCEELQSVASTQEPHTFAKAELNESDPRAVLEPSPPTNAGLYDVDVNAADEDGMTALHRAAASGDTRSCASLIARRANTALRDLQWFCPIHYAAKGGHVEIIHALLGEGHADVESETRTGATALHLAVQERHESAARAIISHSNMDFLDHQDQHGRTALHYAAEAGYSALAATLIKAGADATKKDFSGKTALEVASFNGRVAESLTKDAAPSEGEGGAARADVEAPLAAEVKSPQNTTSLGSQRAALEASEELETADASRWAAEDDMLITGRGEVWIARPMHARSDSQSPPHATEERQQNAATASPAAATQQAQQLEEAGEGWGVKTLMIGEEDFSQQPGVLGSLAAVRALVSKPARGVARRADAGGFATWEESAEVSEPKV
eukprot:CAMPEP_0181304974 /NCGR_PEP_ID=MMETSP1101-20121128/9462_1 /TAXON_ID=46948 /ORGANISM="Rhodomonas abbreviata, Strain Caron Lab Isolate" /LENGTH=1619 /DNA_ID=CAMNT_0023410819 /DNA_START=23 /DNA_END=4879 /DNA_ORIENTATION=-